MVVAGGCASPSGQGYVDAGYPGDTGYPGDHGRAAAGVVGAGMLAADAGLLRAPHVAGALVAYALYDPFAPTWHIEVSRIADDIWRLDLRMKRLATGGAGEASHIFRRNARRIAEGAGHQQYEVMLYEEGIESTRPFAQRVARGEIRLTRDR
jgi:hypothetical protein